MSDPILTIKNLAISFAQKKGLFCALSDFNMNLYPGQCVGLVGESGSGKTLAGLSMLQLLPTAARVSHRSDILYQGQSLLDLPERNMRKIRGRRISMIFQDALSAFNPVLTVGYQLSEVLRLHFNLSKKNAYERSLALLDSVGMASPEFAFNAYPHQLSGGMRQRAMIAMAVATEPDVIVADEPTTALDVTIQAQILALLKKLQNDSQSALLFIGHDLSVVSQMADEVIVLEKGITVEKANCRNFFSQPVHSYSQKLLSAVLPVSACREPQQKVEAKPLLSVDQLQIIFDKKIKAVDNVSLEVRQGETVAIVGESGSGKTTTAKGILQLLKQAQGSVIFEGQSLKSLNKRSLRKARSDMQFIFQDPAAALNPRMLIADSLSEGLLIQKLVKNRDDAMRVIDALLTQVGLSPEMKSRYPHEFSGGQKQRLCIARALSLSPKLLILDEPTSALDVSIQKQILDLLITMQKKHQLAYLLITHSLSVVAYLADRVVVMHRGKIVETGSAKEILTQPKHAYTKSLLAAMPKLNV